MSGGTAGLFRVLPAQPVDLAAVDPDSTEPFGAKGEAERRLKADAGIIDQMQDRLFAEGRQALLVVLQGTDTAGKDSTIRRVFGLTRPLGLRITPFGVPSREELAHDFLWRIHKACPPRGMIGVFNRSHYEDVLVARVRALAPPDAIEARYGQINAFEKTLAENGTRIVKILLHISREEQRKRLQERIDDPAKRWKITPADLADHKDWEAYLAAYAIALSRCSTEWAPWFIVPANRKWARDAAVSAIVREALEAMKPAYPQPDWEPGDLTVQP